MGIISFGKNYEENAENLEKTVRVDYESMSIIRDEVPYEEHLDELIELDSIAQGSNFTGVYRGIYAIGNMLNFALKPYLKFQSVDGLQHGIARWSNEDEGHMYIPINGTHAVSRTQRESVETKIRNYNLMSQNNNPETETGE